MRRILSVALLSAAALSLASAALAQAGPPQARPPGGPPAMAAGPLTVRPLTSSVYWVEGGVGNAGIIVGPAGVTLVDTTISAAGAQTLLAEVAKITSKPVTAVVLTHGDTDHVGGLAGLPPGLTIIAQAGNKARMAAGVAAGRSRVPADRLPSRTIAERETLDLGGLKVELLHWAPAHTDGDLVVYLPSEKVVFTGDIFALDQPRALIHREQAGTSDGWVITAKGILALDADRFVVGHGQVQTKAQLQQRVDQVIAEKAQIAALVARSVSLAQIQAEVADPPPGQAAAAPGGPRFEPFSQVVYEELTEKR